MNKARKVQSARKKAEKTVLDAQAFPQLSPAQIRDIEKFGVYKSIPQGQFVWEAGTADVCMFVVVKGAISITDPQTQLEIARHRAGNFTGDIDVMNRRPSVVSAYAKTNLDVLVVDGEGVRAIVNEHPILGEVILRAFLRRREIMQSRGDIGVKIIGSRFSADTLRIREFLARNRYPQSWDDLEDHQDVQAFLEELGFEESETPIVILPNGNVLRSPSTVDLGRELGLTTPSTNAHYDLVVVGTGPAGLASAVYGASEGLVTLVLDSEAPGGQAGTSSRIENYMGFPLGVTGQQLADSAVTQAEKFGAKLVSPACVTSMVCSKDGAHLLTVDTLGEISARCVVLACGASYRRLEIDNLGDFENRGVYYSATFIEQSYCVDEVAMVVGGGNSAGQATIFMSQKASKVILVIRSDDIRKQMSSYLAKRIESNPRIEVRLQSEVCALGGDQRLRNATIVRRDTGSYEEIAVTSMFVMIGAKPHTDWLSDKIALDNKGFIVSGQDLTEKGLWKQSRPPFFLETSCPGVFAAGDARSGSVKRVASAVGEGSMAVAFVHEFLSL